MASGNTLGQFVLTGGFAWTIEYQSSDASYGILQLDNTTGSQFSRIAFPETVGNAGELDCIVSDGTYLYVGGIIYATGLIQIWRISLTDFSIDTLLGVSALGHSGVQGMVIDNGYLYVTPYEGLTVNMVALMRVYLPGWFAGLTVISFSDGNTSWTKNQCMVAVDATRIYVVNAIGGGAPNGKFEVNFIDKASFTYTSTSVIDTGSAIAAPPTLYLFPTIISGYLYQSWSITSGSTDIGISKVKLADTTVTNHVYSHILTDAFTGLIADEDGGLWGVTGGTPSLLSSIDPAALTVLSSGPMTGSIGAVGGSNGIGGALYISVVFGFYVVFQADATGDPTQYRLIHICSPPPSPPAPRPDLAFVSLASPTFPGGLRFELLVGSALWYSASTGSAFTVWADASPPSGGPWNRISWSNFVAIGWMTGNDGTLLAYQNNAPTWATTAVTPDGVFGKVMSWVDAPTANGYPKALVLGTTNKLASGGITDIVWNAQDTLPITAVWACMANNGYPEDGGRIAVLLTNGGSQYVYTDYVSHTYQTATDLPGDWRDVQSDGSANRGIFAAVGATGGANLIKHIAELRSDNPGFSTDWVVDTPPVGWNPVDPRLICVNFTSADATFIAISSGPGNGQVITCDVTFGSPSTFGAWTVLAGTDVANVTWTAIDWDWQGNPGSYVILAGVNTVTGDVVLLVSGDGDITTWTQKDLSQAPA